MSSRRADEKLAAGPSGFKMIMADRYLLLIGALVYGFGVDGTKYTKDQLNQCLDWAKKLKANTKTTFNVSENTAIAPDIR